MSNGRTGGRISKMNNYLQLAAVQGIMLSLASVQPGTWVVDIYPKVFGFGNHIRLLTKSRTYQPFLT
jgi:hypothetical protein